MTAESASQPSPISRAVVLAAGRGTRMMPLTTTQPKPLIPVAGVPILERILIGLQCAGIREVILVIGYLGEMIHEYFGNGERFGLQLLYREQPSPNGTAGALMPLEELCGSAPFFLSWGDILVSPENYRLLLGHYSTTPATAILGLNWMDDPCAGAAVYLEEDRVVRIVEKPAPGTSTTHWNNAGIMALSSRIWSYLRQLAPSVRGEYEFTDALHRMIAAGEVIFGHPLCGLWSDVGTPEVVETLNRDARLTGDELH